MLDGNLSRVTRAIEDYFACHPDAADSADGIARWWLAGTGIEATVDEVRNALATLVDSGIAVARRMPDGRLIYAWSRRKRSDGMH